MMIQLPVKSNFTILLHKLAWDNYVILIQCNLKGVCITLLQSEVSNGFGNLLQCPTMGIYVWLLQSSIFGCFVHFCFNPAAWVFSDWCYIVSWWMDWLARYNPISRVNLLLCYNFTTGCLVGMVQFLSMGVCDSWSFFCFWVNRQVCFISYAKGNYSLTIQLFRSGCLMFQDANVIYGWMEFCVSIQRNGNLYYDVALTTTECLA